MNFERGTDKSGHPEDEREDVLFSATRIAGMDPHYLAVTPYELSGRGISQRPSSPFPSPEPGRAEREHWNRYRITERAMERLQAELSDAPGVGVITVFHGAMD